MLKNRHEQRIPRNIKERSRLEIRALLQITAQMNLVEVSRNSGMNAILDSKFSTTAVLNY